MAILSDQSGEIIEAPQASEVYEESPEPKSKSTVEMTNNEFEKVKLWKARINVARKLRDEKLKETNKYIDYIEGNQWHSDESIIGEKATVNLIFANIKKELPYLYFQNPTPIVNPKRGEFELTAFAMQRLLEHYTKFNLGTELKKHIRLAILDAKYAFGCLKTSYTPVFSPNPMVGQPILAGFDEINRPIFATDEEGNFLTENDKIITSELYSIDRVSPREILMDAECRNFSKKARWIGHEIVKPLSYLKNHDLYKNTEALEKNVELSEIFKDVLHKTESEITASKELHGDDTEKVRFVEIYDFENGELLCLPDNSEFFIRQEKVFLSPFSFLKFNESPDNWYPIPDIKIEKPLQREVNIGQSLLITHARRSARKYYYGPNTFGKDEDEELEKAKDPEDLTFFKVQDYTQPPKALDMAAQDPSIYNNLNVSRMNFNEVTGSTEMERGVTEKRKTKGEAYFQESHSTVRRGDKQSLVADFVTDTYENLAKLMQDTLTVPQAVKIIGKTGIFWADVKRDDIQGELFYGIETSELRPQIPEIDRQELTEFLFSLSNFINSIIANPILMQVFNLQGLIKEFAKSYPSLKVENILNMKVTPEQIADMVMMQLQNGQNNTNTGNQNANI